MRIFSGQWLGCTYNLSTTLKAKKMKPFFKTVLFTGLLVGVTDLAAAYVTQFIKTGKFADKMLYYIAGGAMGLGESLKGGFWIGLLGLFFHFFIAFAFTLLFFMLYPKMKLLRYNPYITGILYGLFVGAVMTFVILPLTALPSGPFDLKGALIGWTVLGVVLGIPIAVSASLYYRRKSL